MLQCCSRVRCCGRNGLSRGPRRDCSGALAAGHLTRRVFRSKCAAQNAGREVAARRPALPAQFGGRARLRLWPRTAPAGRPRCAESACDTWGARFVCRTPTTAAGTLSSDTQLHEIRRQLPLRPPPVGISGSWSLACKGRLKGSKAVVPSLDVYGNNPANPGLPSNGPRTTTLQRSGTVRASLRARTSQRGGGSARASCGDCRSTRTR